MKIKLVILRAILLKLVLIPVQLFEVLLRVCFLITPIGIHYLLLQLRDKPLSTFGVDAQLNSSSVWMYASPGILVMCKNGKELKGHLKEFSKSYSANFPKVFKFVRFTAYILVIVACLVNMYKGNL